MSRRIRYLDRIGLAILLVIVIGGALWITMDQVVQRRHLRQVQALGAGELAALKRAEGNLQSLKAASGRVQSEAEALSLRIPPRIEMGTLLKKLHGRLKERQITLLNLDPQGALSEELYTKIPIRLLFQGNFVQVYRFLYDLERMDQLLIPEKMTISTIESPQRSCQVELMLLAIERKKSG